MASGVLSSSLFTAVTSPLTGAYTSAARFYRLNHGAFFFCFQLAAHCRRLDEHHVAQQFLCMLGDADADGAVCFGLNPLVGCGVLQVAWVAQ